MESVWDTIYNANSIAESETSSVWSEEDDLGDLDIDLQNNKAIRRGLASLYGESILLDGDHL